MRNIDFGRVKQKENRRAEDEEEVAEERPREPGSADDAQSSDLNSALEQELEDLREQLQEQQRLAAEAQENFLRARADIDNYRRRARQEMEDVRRYGIEQLVGNLLPVVDDFERALEAAESSQKAEALKEGVALIYNKLQDVLAKTGVEPIPAVGQPFDPTLHEAIMQVEAENGQSPNTVVEELRRGYRLNDRVIRASLVKVSA